MTETIPALFARQAAALKDKTLFLAKQGTAYRPITWRQAYDDMRALSAFLLQQQVNTGDRILILSESRPEWGMADLAIQSVGAWTVPLYPNLAEQDLRTICDDCQPVACVASTSDQVQKLLAATRQRAFLRFVIVMDAHQQHPAHVIKWSEALPKGRGVEGRLHDFFEHRRSQIRSSDTATLIYTSGTTGEPKGVMLSHSNFLSNVQACLTAIPIRSTDLHLSFLPLSHVFERMAGWYLMLSVGASVAYAESMETIPEDMADVHPTTMLGVPRFFEKLHARIQENLLQSPAITQRLATWALRVGQATTSRLMAGQSIPVSLALQRAAANLLMFKRLKSKLGGRLRFFVSGGAPLPKAIGEFFYSVGVAILEGYGLTETSPVITVNRLPTPRFGSVGKPLEGVEVRIADDGEILTRGPHVMQGYYKKPEATAAAIVDGWLHTGDIGHFDREGYLFITDRKKDLIKTAGGKFVAPQKLENLFVSDPHISQAFVYGDKRPYCVALIVPNKNQLRQYAQQEEIPGGSVHELVRDTRVVDFYWRLVQAKQQDLASFEQVKKIALLEEEFSQASGELTPTLKAKRNMIAQRYASLLDALYQPASP